GLKSAHDRRQRALRPDRRDHPPAQLLDLGSQRRYLALHGDTRWCCCRRMRCGRTRCATRPTARMPRPCSKPLLDEAVREARELEARVRAVDLSLEAMARDNATIARLRTVPGVGVLTATALVAFVGDVQRFPSGRHLAGYLGLTPRESSSGLRRRLGAISKRGDPDLRMLLIHGARSLLWHAKKTTPRDRLRSWALDRERARGHNKTAVALANKLTRVIWAVWRRERPFGVPSVKGAD